MRSRTSPPRSRRPLLAPMDEATSTAVGVARPSAQGQAMTSTSIASLVPNSRAALLAPADTALRADGNSVAPASDRRTCSARHKIDHRSLVDDLAQAAAMPAPCWNKYCGLLRASLPPKPRIECTFNKSVSQMCTQLHFAEDRGCKAAPAVDQKAKVATEAAMTV
jgi:hypothetical protein